MKSSKTEFFRAVAQAKRDNGTCKTVSELLKNEQGDTIKPDSVYQRIMMENKKLKDLWEESRKKLKEAEENETVDELPEFVVKIAKLEKPQQLPVLKKGDGSGTSSRQTPEEVAGLFDEIFG